MAEFTVVSKAQAERARDELASHYADHFEPDGPIAWMDADLEDDSWIIVVQVDRAGVVILPSRFQGIPVRLDLIG